MELREKSKIDDKLKLDPLSQIFIISLTLSGISSHMCILLQKKKKLLIENGITSDVKFGDVLSLACCAHVTVLIDLNPSLKGACYD